MGHFARITAKIERLREQDQAYQTFGANHHKYRFHAPLEEEQVQRFEDTHGVVLPAEYRWFLTHVGDGGAGPYYGIRPLEESVNTYVLERDPLLLSKPFPLEEAFDYTAFFLKCADVPTWEEWNRRCDEDPDYAARVEERVRQNAGDYPYARGTLDICHFGCGILFMLIVSGQEAGHIWIDHLADDMGIFPVRGQREGKSRVGFLDWYENWLDTSLLELAGKH